MHRASPALFASRFNLDLGRLGAMLSARLVAEVRQLLALIAEERVNRLPRLRRRDPLSLPSRLTTDPEALLGDGSIDVVVDVMGGVDPARAYVERALDTQRSVVTANKMLLAMHGPALIDRAIANGAERFGFAIKHLAIGRDRGDGIELRVHPALVHPDTPLANVGGVLNAISVEGRALGPCLLSGRGARGHADRGQRRCGRSRCRARV